MSVASHSTNSYLPFPDEDLGKDAIMSCAALRFRPQMMMWMFPLVCLAKVSATA